MSEQALLRGMDERGHFELLWWQEGEARPSEVKQILDNRVDKLTLSLADIVVRPLQFFPVP